MSLLSVLARSLVLAGVFLGSLFSAHCARAAEGCDGAFGAYGTIPAAEHFDAALGLELALIGFELDIEPDGKEGASPDYRRRVRRVETEKGRAKGEPSQGGAVLWARVLCADGQRLFLLEIVLDGVATFRGESVTRVIDAREISAELGPRTLAIALTELLRTTLIERELEQLDARREELRRLSDDLETGEASRKQAALDHERSIPAEKRSSVEEGDLQVSAALAASGTSSVGGPMFGGELGVSYQSWRLWRFSFEGTYAVLTERTPLGKLGVRRASVSSGGDFLFPQIQGLFLGPRTQLHLLRGQGHSYSGGVEEEPTDGYALSLSIRGSFELPVGEFFRFRTSLEAGPVLRAMTFTAAGRDAYSLDGLQLQWAMGAVLRL